MEEEKNGRQENRIEQDRIEWNKKEQTTIEEKKIEENRRELTRGEKKRIEEKRKEQRRELSVCCCDLRNAMIGFYFVALQKPSAYRRHFPGLDRWGQAQLGLGYVVIELK